MYCNSFSLFFYSLSHFLYPCLLNVRLHFTIFSVFFFLVCPFFLSLPLSCHWAICKIRVFLVSISHLTPSLSPWTDPFISPASLSRFPQSVSLSSAALYLRPSLPLSVANPDCRKYSKTDVYSLSKVSLSWLLYIYIHNIANCIQKMYEYDIFLLQISTVVE